MVRVIVIIQLVFIIIIIVTQIITTTLMLLLGPGAQVQLQQRPRHVLGRHRNDRRPHERARAGGRGHRRGHGTP